MVKNDGENNQWKNNNNNINQVFMTCNIYDMELKIHDKDIFNQPEQQQQR